MKEFNNLLQVITHFSDKKVADEYLRPYKSDNKTGRGGFYITFEGELFRENNGYEKLAIEREDERIKFELLRKNQEGLQKIQTSLASIQANMAKVSAKAATDQVKIQAKIVCLTQAVAVATAIAAVYYITQTIPWIVQIIAYFHYLCSKK